MDFLPLVFVLFGCLLLVILIAGMVASEQREIENAQALARRLSLEFVGSVKLLSLTRPQREVGGRSGGRSVRVWSYTTGSGRSRVSWVALSAELHRPFQAKFELRRVSFMTRLASWVSQHRSYTGDADFDREWYLDTNDARLVSALTPDLRADLRRLSTAPSSRLAIEGNKLLFAEEGSFGSLRSIARMEHHLPLVVMLAGKLEASLDAAV